jgi:uncharacterized integral membrane protein (TIGR00698 family)
MIVLNGYVGVMSDITSSSAVTRLKSRIISARALGPGILVCLTVAAAAQMLSEHYHAPQMLFALLLGVGFHFLSEEGPCVPGIHFCSTWLLRTGVALLGIRLTLEDVTGLGLGNVLLVIAGVGLTIIFGIGAARILGQRVRFGLLTGGAVAICGASAALAISSILPNSGNRERDAIFTVIAVTTFSTIAMVIYPIMVKYLGMDDQAAGIFLGGTIHDVAQVVGAGYSISDEVGDLATIIKLFRVSMLVPVVLVLTLVSRSGETRGLPVPLFVIGFCALVALNSTVAIPEALHQGIVDTSRWCLVTAIAALGVKTSFKAMLTIGYQPVALILAETIFIAGWVLLGTRWLAS